MTRRLITYLATVAVGGMSALGLVPDAAATPSRVSPKEAARQSKHVRKAEKSSVFETVPRLNPGGIKPRNYPDVKSYPSPRETFGAAAPERVSSADAAYIYGGAIFADNWTSDHQPVGVYSFAKNDGSTVKEVAIGEDYIVTGGGVFASDRYHYVSYMSFMGMILAQLYTVDFNTWEVERCINVNVGSVAQDMAYDPTTGNAYGCFMNDNADGWVFGYLNLETGERTHLKDLDLIILSVGVTSKGDVYGVGIDGILYKFDKHTGDRKAVGDTGRRPVYSASGCFDLQTDTFYWECIESDAKARLYTIDLGTGAATYLTDIANNTEFSGMFIPMPDAADDAPAKAEEISAEFNGAALEGYASFTMPSMTFGSSRPLTGELTYVLLLNEQEYARGTAAPGERVSVPVKVMDAGTYRLAVTVENACGTSPVTQTEIWIGGDTPLPVSDLTLRRNASTGLMTLTWSAPAGSVHDGFFDPELTTYDVVRHPGGEKVATDLEETIFTETIPDGEDFILYQYEVTPRSNGITGVSEFSNRVGAGVCDTPYFNAIDSDTDFDALIVENTNGDDHTWKYDDIHTAARCQYSNADNYKMPMDDWIFTPAIRLQSGRMYRLAADLSCYGDYSERAEFAIGTEPDSKAMKTVMEPVTVKNPDPKCHEVYATVETEGKYHFGIHGCSPADRMYLYVDNICVEEGPLVGTPGSVTELSIRPAEQGLLSATLTFKAPVITVDGAELTSISNIDIYRGADKIHSIINPAPGETLTYVDGDAKQSDNVYRIVCVNGKGEGYSVEKSVYVGHDRPGLPVNVRAHEENGNAVITWEAPKTGESGGYFDPSAVTYTVLRANDEKELAVGLTELTFTDENPPLGGFRQEFFQYYVYAQSPAGYGYGQVSNTVSIGEPYGLPFVESFPGGHITKGPWDVRLDEYSEATWKVASEGTAPSCTAFDGDEGLLTFNPGDTEDSEGTLVSSKISIADAADPVVEFRYYSTTMEDCRIYVEVSADDADFVRIGTVNFEDSKGEGWQKAQFRLDAFSGAKAIQISLTPKCPEGIANVHIDAISVKDNYEYNLSARSISAPQRMMVGENSKVTFTVENTGRKTAKDYTLELLRDGKPVQTLEGATTLPDSSRDYVFEVTPKNIWSDRTVWTARIIWEKDLFEGDNTSAEAVTELTRPNYPAVNDLTGKLTDGGDVSLEWSEPTIGTAGGEKTLDDVEQYESFSINGFGDWAVRDYDGASTFGINDNMGGMLQYPNAGTPMAFMVFNPEALGINTIDGMGKPTEWAPHSGEHVFASFSSTSGKNDDWLISPLLPGIEQEISFWVKSVTDAYGYEKFEVYYSTTGIEKSDFKRIGDIRTAPVVWYEEKVTLPAGTRYFAIRCISEDAYIFMLDDLSFYASSSYTGELSLVGYNVYRDDECLTDEPMMEMEYIDTPTDCGSHRYAVTVVYDKGESAYSNIVDIDLSAISQIEAAGVRVVAAKGRLTVIGADGKAVKVFTTDGMTVTSFIGNGNDEILLPADVYVVTVDKTPVKAIVR